MQTKSKRIRGSAVVDPEGVFIFTPYAQLGDSERAMQLLRRDRFTTTWVSRRRVCVRISLPCDEKTPLPPLTVLVADLIRSYEALRTYIQICHATRPK